MALIKCLECGKEISDKANSCPFCGCPNSPILIEQTSKTWKLVMLFSWILMIVGWIMFLNGLGNGGFHNPSTDLGFLLGGVGTLFAIISKIGAWWNHK